jgi:AcrR family transcriptional regulator
LDEATVEPGEGLRGPAPARTVRRRLGPDARRREILYAALRVLRRRGPVNCRVEDITAEARTAKGNFYRYFPTWDDLLGAVRDHLLGTYSEELVYRLADRTPVDWWTALDEEVDRFLTFQVKLGGLHDVAFHGPVARGRVAGEYPGASVMASLVAGGAADGVFAGDSVAATAALVFHLVHGAADEVMAGRDREEVQHVVLLMVHRALEPRLAKL